MTTTIFAANESTVLLDGKPIDGVRSLEYTRQQDYQDVHALGTAERIGVVAGAMSVQGRLRVVSTAKPLDSTTGAFQVTANLVHGATKLTVTFDECFLTGRSMDLAIGGSAESVYEFTATRVREEQPS
jgi:hypothetical protein